MCSDRFLEVFRRSVAEIGNSNEKPQACIVCNFALTNRISLGIGELVR